MKSVKAVWDHYSSDDGAKGKPPTPGDDKLRVKHVLESVPYNLKHATDHLESMHKQLDKLDKTDKALANKLRKKGADTLHKAGDKLHG